LGVKPEDLGSEGLEPEDLEPEDLELEGWGLFEVLVIPLI
jgi:hypothetical protein